MDINQIKNLIRIGTVSAVNGESCSARVAFEDKDNMVSAELPIITIGSKQTKAYWLPEVGTQVLVYDKWSPADTLAGCILRQITGSLGTVDRGVKARPGIIVLNSTHMPAVLVEMGFITNDADCRMLINQQDELARAIARGVTDYITERGE